MLLYNNKLQKGVWLLPSIFDLMIYPLIYNIFNNFYLTIPLHAPHSKLSLYLFRDGGFLIPYWEQQNIMNKFYPDRMNKSSNDVDIILKIFPEYCTTQAHDYTKNTLEYINNLLKHLYDWNNWLDNSEYVDFEKNLKAISLFHLIVSSISYNKYITNDFIRLANTFRSLDLISNLIVDLSHNKNNKDNESNVFNKLFHFEEFTKDNSSFYGCNSLALLCKKIIPPLQNFNGNYSSERFNVFKEFRNYFTHGTFDQNEKRFKSLMNCTLPPYEINFIPILWLAILGSTPRKILDFFTKSAG